MGKPKGRNNLGWLISYTLASMAASFVVVKIFDYIFAETASGVVSIARFGLFVLTWTAITAKAGMRGFTKRVRRVRQTFIKRILH